MIFAGMMSALVALSACSTTTNSAATPSNPADGSTCTATSVTVCSADLKATLSCNTTTLKYVATACTAGSTCQVVAGAAQCKGTTPTDAASSTDTNDGSDAIGAKDSNTGKDTTAKDIITAPTKCGMTDTNCIQVCIQDKCTAQVNGCLGDTDCAAFYKCIGSCQQGVSPPADVTGTTCTDKCVTLAPEAAQQKLGAFENCVVLDCIQCNATDKDYQSCVGSCVQAKCGDSVGACKATTGCKEIITCMSKCGQDQKCLQACVAAAPAADQKLYMAVNTCFVGAESSCK